MKLTATLILLLCALPGRAADWPCYRGAAGDGVVGEKMNVDWPASGPPKLFTSPLGDGGNGTFGGAAIVNGRVYIPGRKKMFEAGKDLSKDIIFCLDAEKGAELWRHEYASPAPAPLSYGNGHRATPLVAANRVYTLSAFGQLVCLDAADGRKIWERNFVSDFKGVVPKFGVAAAPIVEGELLICEPGGPGAAFVGLNKLTGAEIWRSGDSKASYAAPQVATVGGVRQIIGFPSSGLMGLNIADGKVLWSIRLDDQKNIAAPIVAGNTIIASNVTYGLSAFEVSCNSSVWTTKRLWNNPEERLDTCSPVRDGDCLYYYLYNQKKVKCMSITDGSVKWALPFEGFENAQLLLLAPGRLAVTTDTGVLALFEVSSDRGTERMRFQAVGKNALGCAAVANGRLYVRDSQALTCFDVSSK